MDRNPDYFPLILIICVIMTSIFFVIALVISTMHKRNLKLKEKPVATSDNKNVLIINEDQLMEAYLKKNEQDQ